MTWPLSVKTSVDHTYTCTYTKIANRTLYRASHDICVESRSVLAEGTALVSMAPQVDDRLRKLADASSEPILAVHVEPTDDMVSERARASFDSEELAIELNGGRALLEKK